MNECMSSVAQVVLIICATGLIAFFLYGLYRIITWEP